MNVMPSIADFDDPTFDPFDEAAMWGEVVNYYDVVRDIVKRGGPVQEESIRPMMGMPPDATLPSGQRSFIVFSPPDIRNILSDPETFSNDVHKVGVGATFGNSLTLMNAPEHPRYRRIFQKAFLPHVVAEWSNTFIRPVVDGLIGKFRDRGHADLVREFTFPYPFEIIYRQIDLPPADARVFHRLAIAQTQYQTDFERASEAGRKLGAYFEQLVKIRRENPGKDIVSVLARVDVDGERLPDDVVVSFFRQLINAAGDTTYQSTSNMFVGLLRERPDQYQMLLKDRSLVSKAIEETLRWEGPVNMSLRTVMRDVEICGVKIPEGAIVETMTGLAGRDPERFENPDQFDILRRNSAKHMAFSLGPHICLGQHLARLEMTRALKAILDNFPKLRLDPDHPPPQIQGYSMRRPKNIFVRFD